MSRKRDEKSIFNRVKRTINDNNSSMNNNDRKIIITNNNNNNNDDNIISNGHNNIIRTNDDSVSNMCDMSYRLQFQYVSIKSGRESSSSSIRSSRDGRSRTSTAVWEQLVERDDGRCSLPDLLSLPIL
eukprot:GHVU01160765.1.p1 GENE.GHVU01160765.1~~GHVU01160765.1.p1  ORF type:complete len:128 (+),score=28.57 GHVU01160765.1:124-507(+)